MFAQAAAAIPHRGPGTMSHGGVAHVQPPQQPPLRAQPPQAPPPPPFTEADLPEDPRIVFRPFAHQRDACDFADAMNRRAAAAQGDDILAVVASAAAASAAAALTVPGKGNGVSAAAAAASASSRCELGDGECTAAVLPAEVVRVFCQEVPSEVGYYRKFVAASYAALWTRLSAMPMHDRHFYEVKYGLTSVIPVPFCRQCFCLLCVQFVWWNSGC